MEVDNINVRKARKKDRSKLRCFNCQGFGHFAAACQKPKKKISGDGPPGKQNNLEVEEAPSDQDVEYITFGAMEENGAEGVAVSKAQVGRSPESGRAPLMIKSGVINGKVVKILIDSGATNSLCRVGLGKHVIRSKAVRISGYDGLMSPLTETRELKETVQIDTFTFHDTQLTEWDLKDKAFDVILGQPWFKKHNPVIDWRKHDIIVEVEVPQQLVIHHAEEVSYSMVKMDSNLKKRFLKAYEKTKEFANDNKF
ncbi:hypothetical protein DYB37_011628, partial [Aphanomyces astaci]